MQNWIFRSHYSVLLSIQCIMIFQKSVLHADLVLKKHLLLLITVEKSYID